MDNNKLDTTRQNVSVIYECVRCFIKKPLLEYEYFNGQHYQNIPNEVFLSINDKCNIFINDEKKEPVVITLPDNVYRVYKFNNFYMLIFKDLTCNILNEDNTLHWKNNSLYVMVKTTKHCDMMFAVNPQKLKENNFEYCNFVDVNTGLPYMEQDFEFLNGTTLLYDPSCEYPVKLNGKEVILDFINWKYIER